jgi:hypothetical protein
MEATNNDINSIQFNLTDEFLPDLTIESMSNIFKIFLLDFSNKLFKKEPIADIVIDNKDKIEIKDKVISVKSLVGKNINSYTEIDIPQEYKYA